MTKVKTQNKSIRKRSIADDFGLHANNFSLLHSPGRQLCPYGKELFKSKLVPNGDFRDFTMEDDLNTVGHYIFDKSYEREDKNEYIGSERGSKIQCITDSNDRDFNGETTGNWNNGYGWPTFEYTLSGGYDTLHVIGTGGQYISLEGTALNNVPDIGEDFLYTAEIYIVSGTWKIQITDRTEATTFGTVSSQTGKWHKLSLTGVNGIHPTNQNSIAIRCVSSGECYFKNFSVVRFSENSGEVVKISGNLIDVDQNGLADGWGFLYPAVVDYEIVDGNGFTGNAQRILTKYDSQTLGFRNEVVGNLISGKLYKFRFKARGNLIDTRLGTGNFYNFSPLIGFSPPSGTAQQYECVTSCATTGYFCFYKSNVPNAGDWLEVGDVEVIELPTKSLLPSGFSTAFEDEFHLPGYSSNRVVNGGTPETTDWVDSNSDGLADSWSWVTSYIGTGLIVTGNGFDTNAQRAVDIGNGATLLGTNGFNNLETGKKYKLSLKYRSNKTLRFNYFSGQGALTMPVNTGDAINWSGDFVHPGPPYNASMYLGITTTNPGDWFEIDEVKLVEVYQENPAYQNGGELYFNGSIEYLYIPNADADDFDPGTGNFTIEGWIKTSKTGVYQYIFDNYDGDGYLFRITSSNQLQFHVRVTSPSTDQAYVISTNTITDGNWHHIAGVRNDGILKVYVDAIDVGGEQTGDPTGWSLSSTNNVGIGKSIEHDDHFFNGHMTEVRYSNVARTADEIKQSYGAGKGWTFGIGFTTKENENFTQKLVADITTSGIQSFNFEDGKLYKCGFRAKGYSGNANDDDIAMYTSLGPIIGYQSVGTDETWHEYDTYFAGDGGDSLNFYVGSGSQIAFDDVKVQEVDIPPVSNFAEDFSKGGAKFNIIFNNNISDIYNVSSAWDSFDNNGIRIIASEGAGTQGNMSTSDNNTLVSGEMYRLKIKATAVTGSIQAGVCVTASTGYVGGASGLDLSVGNNCQHFVYTGAGEDAVIRIFDIGAETASITITEVWLEKVTNGNHGLMQNDMEDDQPTYPYALEYDGVNQSIKYDVINIDKDDSFILFAWIYININGTSRTILSNQDNAPTYRGFIFYVDAAEKLGAIFRNTTSNYLGKYVNTALSEGWHFAAVSYDGSLSVSGMKLYLESVEVTETTILANSLTNTTISSVPIYSGAREGVNNFYNNKIGDTGIIIFDGNGRPSSLPSNYTDWISRIYNATKWKYKN